MMLVCAVYLILIQCVIIWRQYLNTAWWQDCWENASTRIRALSEENGKLRRDRDVAINDLAAIRSQIKNVLKSEEKLDV